MAKISKNSFCKKSGCNNFATNGGFCEIHQNLVTKRGEHKAHADVYDYRWTKCRNAYFSEHPLCEDCLEKGITEPAREVHHIKPVEFGGDVRNWENLISLCSKCHHQRHINLKAQYFINNQIRREK